jgi:hypothetical protein
MTKQMTSNLPWIEQNREKYSKERIRRTIREIGQLGFFDQE